MDFFKSIGSWVEDGNDYSDDYSTIQVWEDATDGTFLTTGDRAFGLLRGEAHTTASQIVFTGVTSADSSTYHWLSTLDERADDAGPPVRAETATHNFDHTDISGARIIRSNSGNVLDINSDFMRIGGTEGNSTGSIGISNPNSTSSGTVAVTRQDGSDQIWNQIVIYKCDNNDRSRATQGAANETSIFNN